MRISFLSLILFLVVGVSAQTATSETQLKKVFPVSYPAEASKTGLEGTVIVVVNVDDKGKVSKVVEATGPGYVCPSVDRADVVAMRLIASRAAEKAVFVPAMKDGKTVSSQTSIQFEFKDPSPKKSAEKGGFNVELSVGGEPSVKAEPVDPAKIKDNNATVCETPRMPMRLGVYSNATVEKAPPSSTTTDTKSISGGVLNGKALSLPTPKYPAAAMAIKATGMVTVQVTVDTNGVIFSAVPISGHPLLRASARNAACSSRFSPTLLIGEPVKVTGVIVYNFVR